MRRALQWVLIAIPLVCGILIGLCVCFAILWWRAFLQGYMIGRLDEHP
jgi:hypothetical protein